jgi:hypothetical protein
MKHPFAILLEERFEMSIDHFHTMMASSQPNTPLIAALRQVQTVQGPQRIALRTGNSQNPNFVWTGWNL